MTPLNVLPGSGEYILSRLKEKQNTETRLERMEQIVEEILSPEEQKGKVRNKG